MEKTQINKITIIPESEKQTLMLEALAQKTMLQTKCMSLEEFLEKITFQTTKEAIYYLMKKYKCSYANAVMYLKELKHVTQITESTYPNVQNLLEMKKKLEKEHLLIKDTVFLNYIKGKTIEIRGYSLTIEQRKWLKELEKETLIEFVEKESKSYTHFIYAFDTIEEEVSYVAASIAEKIHQGISIQHIFLSNITEEYLLPLKRIFAWFHIPIELNESHHLYGNLIVKKWLNALKENPSESAFEPILCLLKTEEDYQIYKTLVDLYNEYVMIPKDSIWLECIEEECKQKNIPISKQSNAVRVKELRTTNFKEEDYVYVMGMNQENIPRTYQDESYLNDTICKTIGIDTTLDKNKQEKQTVIEKINAIPNGILTYKKKTPFGLYYPSSLLDELQVEKKIPKQNPYFYSDEWNQISLSKQLDQYLDYNEKDKNMDMLYAHYPTLSYRTYENQFSGISKENLRNYLDHKLLLSYTSLDHFYHCNFRYYMSHILKVDTYEETFAQKVGNLFHYILSIAFQKDFDFEVEWKRYHQDKIYSAKEKFFLKKLKKELQFVITTIQEQNTYNSLAGELYEQKIFKSISGEMKITFMGIVDKIKFQKEDGVIYAAIIDYKTGTIETNLNQSIYGIGMQLPIYLYLVKNKKDWNSVKVIGFYLQKMIQNEFTNDENKEYQQMKKENMKLEGYSIDKPEWIEKLDSTYMDSCVIKSLKMGKNGFYAYSKILNEEKMNRLEHLVDKKLKEAAEQIENGNFRINPKQIGSKLVGCEFCKYHDLCFQTEKDIVYLSEYKNLEFLEEDAL